MQEDVIIVFVKSPVRGNVKTRIAKTLGDEEALRIYNYLLDYTLKMCKETEMMCYIYFDEKPWLVEERFKSENFMYRLQRGKNLGEKMFQAFFHIAKDFKRAVIIGSDCPFITPQIIYKSFAALNSTPLSIGPSTDGGYYLLGIDLTKVTFMRLSNLFRNIEWSSETVLNDTLDRAKEYNLEVTFLPEFYDIDTQADWENYEAQKNK